MRTLWLVFTATAHALLQIYWGAQDTMAWAVFISLVLWLGSGFHWLAEYNRQEAELWRDMARSIWLAELGRYPPGWKRMRY